MFQIKTIEGIQIVYNSENNECYFTCSECGRLANRVRSIISETIGKKGKFEKINGIDYKLLKVEDCLPTILRTNPKILNSLVNIIKNLTGNYPNLPDFSKITTKKSAYSGTKPLGNIYLFDDNLNAVKLGFTNNIEKRLKNLQRWEGELSVICFIKSTLYKEKSLHKLLHSTGAFFGEEWYPRRRKDEIVELLKTVAPIEQYGVL
jgi:hypothetical protein